MRKSLLFSLFLFIYTIGVIAQENTTIDCSGGPITTTFCYDTGLDNSYSFISSDGGPLNLVIDFDFIEEGSEKGAPKYMEWYGAFGLLVTLIWLYLELLRLLAKMKNR